MSTDNRKQQLNYRSVGAIRNLHDDNLRDDYDFWMSQKGKDRLLATRYLVEQTINEGEKVSNGYIKFIELLIKYQVKFLLVGGYAVSYHGNPRYTAAIDFLIGRSPDNIQKVLKAIDEFGMLEDLGVTINDLTKPESIINIGYPPDRIVLLTSINGVVWDEAWKTKETTQLCGVDIYVIGKVDLIKNKITTNRLKDIMDLQAIDFK